MSLMREHLDLLHAERLPKEALFVLDLSQIRGRLNDHFWVLPGPSLDLRGELFE